MALFYFETRGLDRWCPNTAPEKPSTADVGGHKRIKSVAGIGPRVRRVKEVPADLLDLSVDELQERSKEKGWKEHA